MVTEIGARDLGDQQRYNMLEVSETECSVVGTLAFGWHKIQQMRRYPEIMILEEALKDIYRDSLSKLPRPAPVLAL